MVVPTSNPKTTTTMSLGGDTDQPLLLSKRSAVNSDTNSTQRTSIAEQLPCNNLYRLVPARSTHHCNVY